MYIDFVKNQMKQGEGVMTALLRRMGERGKRPAELPILFENYLKVVKLNVFTGDFHYVKTYRDTVDKSACGSFYKHADRMVASGLIHSDDAEYFHRYFDPDYLSERLSGGTGGKRIVLHGLRYRVLEQYETVDFEIIASKSFSAENPWAVLCITCPESCRSNIGTAVIPAYLKIISVKISDGSYEPVYMTDSEISCGESLGKDITKWFLSFADAGNIAEKDKAGFLGFVDRKNILSLLETDGETEFSYHRRIDGKFRPVTMKIARRDGRAFIYIYESDIGNKYADKRRTAEKYYDDSDILTGIRNGKCFDERCRSYDNDGRRETQAVLYAVMTEREGISDSEQLRSFAIRLMEAFGRTNCYRTGKREFAAISSGSSESFVRRGERLDETCRRDGVSIGICADTAAASIKTLYENAEKKALSARV